MKPWIKELIKTTERGYLTISDRDQTRIIPFPYTYDKGHLFGSLDILQADLLKIIDQYPVQHVLIILEDKQVGITGKIFINKGDLDEGWKQYNSSNIYIQKTDTKFFVEQVPHLAKRVVIDFIPMRIEVDDEGEHRSYEMEIL